MLNLQVQIRLWISAAAAVFFQSLLLPVQRGVTVLIMKEEVLKTPDTIAVLTIFQTLFFMYYLSLKFIPSDTNLILLLLIRREQGYQKTAAEQLTLLIP
jgi:hypothetical protein